ncbi:MAG: energy transducer TonB [Gammaproteobacteria bacterium]|jgi:protein TonB
MGQLIGRYAISFLSAAIVVFTLFYIMQYLIANADHSLDEDEAGRLLEFVRVPEAEVITPKPPPKKPPPPDDPPPEPPPPQLADLDATADSIAVTAVAINTAINMDNSGFQMSNDGEYLPIVKVRPIYPNSALSRGIEGYVIVEFTVTRQGTTKDAKIVEAKPANVFNRAALQAAGKFKYKPRVIDGVAIEVPGVQNKISFEIEN